MPKAKTVGAAKTGDKVFVVTSNFDVVESIVTTNLDGQIWALLPKTNNPQYVGAHRWSASSAEAKTKAAVLLRERRTELESELKSLAAQEMFLCKK